MTKIYKQILRFIEWLVLSIMLLVITLYLLIQLRPVQREIVSFLTVYIEQRSGHHVSIEEISINWLDEATFGKVSLYDFRDSLMFSTDHLYVDFDVSDILASKALVLQEVRMSNSQLRLLRHNDSTKINLSEFISSLSNGKRQPDSARKAYANIASIRMDTLIFSYDDFRKSRLPASRWDYNHFKFHIPNLEVTALEYDIDSLSLRIDEFSAKDERSGFEVSSLDGKFALDPHNLILTEFDLRTPQSTIGNHVRLMFSDPANLAYFEDSVTLDLDIVGSQISPADLRYFANTGGFDHYVKVDAQVAGSLSRLFLQSFSLGIGEGSSFSGRALLLGLPVIENTFIDLSVDRSKVLQEDIWQYAGRKDFYTGDIDFEGNLLGFISDFVADGTFEMEYGSIITDINLKSLDRPQQAVYRGNLTLENLDVGKLINDKRIGKVQFSGNVDGKGLTKETANVFVTAKVSNSEFFDRNFQQIEATGRFASQFFSGDFFIADSMLDVRGQANIDFNSEEELIDFNIDVGSADLFQLGLYDEPMKISTKIDADLKNINVDDARGTISIDSFSIERNNQITFLNTIRLVALQLSQERKLYELQATGLNAKLKGDFRLTDLIRDLPETLKEYGDYFTKQSTEIREYYEQRASDTSRDFTAELEVNAININPYLELLEVPLSVSRSTRLEASYFSRENSNLTIYTDPDTLVWKEQVFAGNVLDFNASKANDTTGVLSVILLESANQKWSENTTTKELNSEIVWFNNTIDANIKLQQEESKTSIDLYTNVKLLKDTIAVRFDKSLIEVFDSRWLFNPKNEVKLLPSKILIKDLEISHENQSLAFDGVYAPDSTTKINVEVNNFDLVNLSTFVPRDFAGTLTTKGRITKLGREAPYRFETMVRIDDLIFDDYLVGNLNGSSGWDNEIRGLKLNFGIRREGIQTILLNGFFLPDQERQIDIDLNIEKANLKLLQPIFSNLASDFDGTASGKFDISGRLEKPVVEGSVELEEGRFKLDYLNIVYNVTGPVVLKENQILLDRLLLEDRFNDRALLEGIIQHTYFTDFALDLSLEYRDFELLNTNRNNNSLYYGTVYATGNLNITGPVNDLLIKANAATRQNTKLYILLDENSDVSQSPFISFVNQEDVRKDSARKEVDLSGLSLDFDLDITDDAYIELIFDPRKGDIIRGSGNGNLQMSINQSGDFQLFGGVEIQKGAYNFTTSFINKEFEIRKGGTINWYGDPYSGILNLEASYRQLADLSNYYSEFESQPDIEDAPKQPVFVILSLDGPMLNPTIDFRLEIDQSISNQAWTRTISSINSESNKEELKRQVFSLLILKKFSPRQSFTVSGLSSVGSSVSEFVSNQLSYWINQVDENLEVSIDLASLDQDAFNTFQLRLAYSFFDGRLRVSRWGNLVDDQQESASTQSIVGNWQIEYLLTKDGRFRAKVFSRQQQENATLNEGQQETGVSLQFVRSFDQFSDILSRERKKAIRRRENENEEEEDTSTDESEPLDS